MQVQGERRQQVRLLGHAGEQRVRADRREEGGRERQKHVRRYKTRPRLCDLAPSSNITQPRLYLLLVREGERMTYLMIAFLLKGLVLWSNTWTVKEGNR